VTRWADDFDNDFRDREELRLEALAERRRLHRATACQCPGEMPGYCPGPASCPMAAHEPEEEEQEDDDTDTGNDD
jgi:hypothetical protein